MKSRYNPVLLAIIMIGFCCALWLNFVRHEIEQNNNSVEMAMEYEGLRKLAALEGLPEETVLKQFKAAGINTLLVYDTTLDRLSKKNEIILVTGGDLQKAEILGNDTGVFRKVADRKNIETNAVYIAEGSDKTIFAEAVEDLKLRYGSDRVKLVNAKPAIVEVLGSTSMIPEDKYDEPLGVLQAPLGLPTADMKKIGELGFNVIVRPQNYTEVNAAQIDSVFRRIQDSGVNISGYMPCGTQVLGYPNMVDYTANKMNEQDLKLIMLEHYTQLQFVKIDGLIPLAAGVDYNAARSYVIDGAEQKKISVGEALRRWALTDEERNIRVNYIRPFLMSKDGKDLMTLNLEYVQNIVRDVKARGYEIGQAGVFQVNNSMHESGFAGAYFPDKMYLIPIALAILAGAVLCAALFINISARDQIVIWGALSVVAVLTLMLGRGLLTRQILAIGAAVFFPVLSMSVIFNIWDTCREKGKSLFGIIGNGLWQLAFAVCMSLIGAFLLSAILTDSRFLLEIDIYRGVKVTFILPVTLTAILYIKKYNILKIVGNGYKEVFDRFNNLINTGITFKHVLILAVLLFVVYYFVGRSGHTGGVPVTDLELKMRAALEQLMYARPRGKELLIGHPAFLLGVYAAYKGAPRLLQFVLACGAVIGQASLVQTFCHMRTPVFMSLMRAFDGYVAGALVGIIGVVLVAFLLPYLVKIKRSYLE